MEPEPEISQMGGSGNPGLRRYSMKLEKFKKVHKSNKRYETRVKGIELKGRLQILKKINAKLRNETFFRFVKQLETFFLSVFSLFFSFANDRNSAKQ